MAIRTKKSGRHEDTAHKEIYIDSAADLAQLPQLPTEEFPLGSRAFNSQELYELKSTGWAQSQSAGVGGQGIPGPQGPPGDKGETGERGRGMFWVDVIDGILYFIADDGVTNPLVLDAETGILYYKIGA